MKMMCRAKIWVNALVALMVGLQVQATIFVWDGGAATDNWKDANNWNPNASYAVTNTTGAHRLNVNSAQISNYTAEQGTTVYTGDPTPSTGGGRGLVIGNGTSVQGRMRISGGSFSTLGTIAPDVVGNGAGSTALLLIDGGTFIGSTNGACTSMGIGGGPTSTIIVSNGLATVSILTMNATTANVILAGGVMEANTITRVGGTANLTFDGGTLRARTDSTTFLTGLTGAKVESGGGKIDTNGKNITIEQSLLVGNPAGGGIEKTGAGTLTLSGENTYSGATTISAGTLSLGHAGAFGTSGTISMNGGTLRFSASNTSDYSARLRLEDDKTATFDTAGQNVVFGNSLATASLATAALTKVGTGALTLGGSNSYGGLTTVSAGSLVVAHNNALGATSSGASVASGASLVLTNGVVITGESLVFAGYGTDVRGALRSAHHSSGEWAGPVALGSGDSRVGAQVGGTLTISGKISDGAGSALVVSADQTTGKVIVSGDSNDYTGESMIIRGTLQLGRDNSLPVSSVLNVHAASSVSDAAFFEMDGFSQTVAGIKRGNTSGPATIKNSSGMLSTLTVTNTSSYTFDSLIAGRLALIKRGLGTLTLSGANTYSNGTTIAEGTLVLSVANAGGTGDLTVANGATCTVTSVSSALADTVTVSLGASAVMNMGEGVTETVRCLYINGVQQGSGVWNAARDPARFSGSGSLVVQVGGGTRVSFF